MESRNIKNLNRIIDSDVQHKVSRLPDFTPNPSNVADPWYSGDFNTAYDDIYEGRLALYQYFS